METPTLNTKKLEILQSPPSRPLLNESPESLCRQCNVWLDVVDYWEDEVKFFNNLVGKKLFEHVSEKERLVLSDALKGLAGARFVDLRSRLNAHEKALLRLISSKGEDETSLRKMHGTLSKELQEEEKRFRALRSLILDFGQIVTKNFFNGNETLQIIHERRAVRKYLPDPVDRLHIQSFLNAACLAPSALNSQSWKFYVLAEPVKIARYAEAVRTEVVKLHPEILRLFAGEHDPIFHGAPLVIFITAPGANEWAAIDTGLCAQNLMLAAKSLGYDSCPVGLATFIEKTHVYHELGIPEKEKVMLGIVLGKGAECPIMHERKTGNVRFIV